MTRTAILLTLVLTPLAAMNCQGADVVAPQAASHGMTITSPAFEPNGKIPAQYTCTGAGISPLLAIKGVPGSARSLALILADPDTAMGTFIHWVTWNIPPSTKAIASGKPPAGGIEGKNGTGETGYKGPCPPTGEHRYIFNLYALDTTLSLTPTADSAALEKAMKGHIVAQAQLIGRYAK